MIILNPENISRLRSDDYFNEGGGQVAHEWYNTYQYISTCRLYHTASDTSLYIIEKYKKFTFFFLRKGPCRLEK